MAPAITCHCGECVKCKRRVYMRDYEDEMPAPMPLWETEGVA